MHHCLDARLYLLDVPCCFVSIIIASVQEYAIDPLSDVLGLLKPNSFGFRGLDAGGRWALSYAPAEGIKCFAIQTGSCWIALDDASETTLLGAGDLILLPGRTAFRLYSAADAPVIDAYQFFRSFPAGETGLLNGGGDCSGVGGFFDFAGLHADLLLGILPAIIHIRAEATRTMIGWLIERLMGELRAPQPGSTLIASHLAQTLLIEALRLHLAEQPADSKGWLFALADKRTGTAIGAMHAQLARRWTLAELARVGGMSRSTFAARFKKLVGESPMEYLARWRMMVAMDLLATSNTPIAAVAITVGYESESAFGAAFKRTFGHSPRQFSRALAAK